VVEFTCLICEERKDVKEEAYNNVCTACTKKEGYNPIEYFYIDDFGDYVLRRKYRDKGGDDEHG
jgi:hypothetical protein